MLVAGTSGALIATMPVTLALPLIGWRGVFWLVAALALAISALLFCVLRDVEQRFDTAPAGQAPPTGGYAGIFGHAYFWRMGVLGLLNTGVFIALQTLWAGPWMMTVLGKTEADTGAILFAFNLALLLAYLAMGWAAPRMAARGWNSHHVIGAGIAGTLLAQAAMLADSGSHAWLWWLLLAACVPVNTLVQSNVALAFPAALAGRANSAYNLQLFIGAFLTQWGFGVFADLLKGQGVSGANAFRAALAVALALQLAAFIYFLASRAQPGRHHV